MKFDCSRFNSLWLTENSDSARRLTSICVSWEGDLTLVRVQNRIRPELNTLSTGNSIYSLRVDGRSERVKTASLPLHVDLRFVEPHGLHFILWDTGVPRMYGLFMPSIHGLRGIEAVGWFTRQHDISLAAFLASVREVRSADESLPLLLATFSARRAMCLDRLQEYWQVLESLSLCSGLMWDEHRLINDSASAKDFQGGRVSEQSCIALQFRAPCLPDGHLSSNRLSGRFPFGDREPT